MLTTNDSKTFQKALNKSPRKPAFIRDAILRLTLANNGYVMKEYLNEKEIEAMNYLVANNVAIAYTGAYNTPLYKLA